MTEESYWEISLRPPTMTWAYESVVTVQVAVETAPTLDAAVAVARHSVPGYLICGQRLVVP